MTLLFLPHRARGMDAEEYLAQIGSMCIISGATHLPCDAGLVSLLSAAPIAVQPFSAWASSA
jgi:hypothetical protein